MDSFDSFIKDFVVMIESIYPKRINQSNLKPALSHSKKRLEFGQGMR